PEVCCSSSRTVILLPSLPLPWTTPGSQCPTVSSSDSRCSATSCSTTTETNVLVLLPIRKNPSALTGLRLFRLATPLVPPTCRSPVPTSASTPGTPVAVIASRSPCKSCCR